MYPSSARCSGAKSGVFCRESPLSVAEDATDSTGLTGKDSLVAEFDDAATVLRRSFLFD